MNLNEFYDKIKEIEKRDFMENYCRGNTGIGHTFWTIMKQLEN